MKGANGQIVGVAGGDLALDALVKTLNSLDFHGNGYAFLADASGQILVHPDQGLVNKTLKDAYPQATPRLNSDISESDHKGRTEVVTFAHVDGLPSVNWYIGLAVDKEKAYASLSDFRTSAVVATTVAVVVIMVLLSMLITFLMRPLNVMGRAMQDIAAGEGDLTRRLDIHNHDELFGQLGLAFNRFVQRIHDSMREVSSSTVQLNEVAARVVSASNSSMVNSDQQANRTNSVAAAINELGAAAQEIAQNAALASGHSSDASNLAHRTQESAQQVQGMIEELQVGAKEAVAIMNDSQHESDQSVSIANQAGERLGSVTQRISEIEGMNQSVAAATEEQTSVVEAISVDITEINTLNQEGVENLQATLRACTDLEQQAGRLKQLVGSFRI